MNMSPWLLMRSTVVKLDENARRGEVNKLSQYDLATVNLIANDCFLCSDQFYLELDALIRTSCLGTWSVKLPVLVASTFLQQCCC